MNLIGGIVYTKAQDGTIKNGLKNRKIADEICEYKEIADDLKDVLEVYQEEKTKKDADKNDPGSGGL